MKKTLVLGPDCPLCETLANLTRQAVGQLKEQGKVPSLDEIKSMLVWGKK